MGGRRAGQKWEWTESLHSSLVSTPPSVLPSDYPLKDKMKRTVVRHPSLLRTPISTSTNTPSRPGRCAEINGCQSWPSLLQRWSLLPQQETKGCCCGRRLSRSPSVPPPALASRATMTNLRLSAAGASA